MAIVRVPSRAIRAALAVALKPVCVLHQIEMREIGEALQQDDVPAGEMVAELRLEEFGRSTDRIGSGHATGPLAGAWEEISWTANYLLVVPISQPNEGTTAVDLCKPEDLADDLIEAAMNVQQGGDDKPSITATGNNMANAGRTDISPNRVAMILSVTGKARVR